MKTCAKCGAELTNKRRKFCSDNCKYWYNSIKKDEEAHLPKKKFRNRNYFFMATGSQIARSGRQGKRCGYMIVGAMSAMIREIVGEHVPVTKENLQRHFKGFPGHYPKTIKLGDGSLLNKQDIADQFGIKI